MLIKTLLMDNENFQPALDMFKKSISLFYPALPDADFEQLAKVVYYKKYNKGEVVLQEGKVCRNFWFIIKGCFRIFSVENGVDVNVRFFFEKSERSHLPHFQPKKSGNSL